MTSSFIVTCNKMEYRAATGFDEDGWPTWANRTVYGVCFSTPDGLEYSCVCADPGAAMREAQGACGIFDQGGWKAINAAPFEGWNTRVIYGGRMYQDLEPWIVSAERAEG